MIHHAAVDVSRFSDLNGKVATIELSGDAVVGRSETARDGSILTGFARMAAGHGLLSGPIQGFTAKFARAVGPWGPLA
jgi:hypothetical protein